MIDLGDAQEIDELIDELRHQIQAGQQIAGSRGDIISFFWGGKGKGDRVGVRLRERIFDKLLPAIDGKKRIILSPDGKLFLLPFEVLPRDRSGFLIDDYRISYVTSGRETVFFRTGSSEGRSTTPIVIGAPDFNLNHVQNSRDRGSTGPDKSIPDEFLFTSLEGTSNEAKAVARLLEVSPILGSDALEGRLKTCRNPRILHIATHGFFLERQMLKKEMDPFVASQPLLRAGLALSGANTFLRSGGTSLEGEDGILTAEDVLTLDLLMTEMVVLSACDAGLGDVVPGEAVLGLRHAFIAAGAWSMVVSLWKIPDKQTSELMEDFYTGLNQGMARIDALRQAQLKLKKRHPEPLFWGAFVCQGVPGKMGLKSGAYLTE